MNDRTRALLVLEDGAVYEGERFGAAKEAYGEVVFTTSMTGYQEILTDPSFAGQIAVMTYPIVGNYGINREDIESRRIQVRGFVVREAADFPSNWRSQLTLDQYLADAGVIGIAGVDTRAITRRIRSKGVMQGLITTELEPERALARLRDLPDYGATNFVPEVSTNRVFQFQGNLELEAAAGSERADPDAKPRIVVVDLGVKYNILRNLEDLGCEIVVVPYSATAQEILALGPDGILFSPGPGDPTFLEDVVVTMQQLIGKKPIFGICLGHQVLGMALGASPYKLKFGHRGGNHPVKDLQTGRVYITSQNHGYAIDPTSLGGDAVVSHINLNDGTVEGIAHTSLPVLSIQYHSEASPGPLDNKYVFERFLDLVRTERNKRG